MLARMKRPLRLVAVLTWIGVLAILGLAPTPTAVVQANENWCSDHGCVPCFNCVWCAEQPPEEEGFLCVDEVPGG